MSSANDFTYSKEKEFKIVENIESFTRLLFSNRVEELLRFIIQGASGVEAFNQYLVNTQPFSNYYLKSQIKSTLNTFLLVKISFQFLILLFTFSFCNAGDFSKNLLNNQIYCARHNWF